jgi:hypothetical protein
VNHSYTPETIKQAIRQGTEIASYRRAAESFQAQTKIPISKSTLQRLVDEYGGMLVEQQEKEAEATVRTPHKEEEIVWRDIPEPDSEVMAVSIDGVMVNIKEEGWKEVKVTSVSAVELREVGEGEETREIRLSKHSYRAGLWEAKEFAKHQWAEGCRRGLEKAKKIVCVSDGALWIWLIIQMCWAPCVEIIDWWHAVEKLWEMANELLGQGTEETKEWVKRQKTNLWEYNLSGLFREIRLLCPRGNPLPETVRKNVGYIFRNRSRMHYGEYRQEGLPVGSGTVESGCKVVVQARMKQAGMRWSRKGAQAMLSLRSVLLSDRWDEDWPLLHPSPKPT